jgi:hypothetical protein
LVSIGCDLLLVYSGEVGFDGGLGCGGVTNEELQRGELVEVEASVVTAATVSERS